MYRNNLFETVAIERPPRIRHRKLHELSERRSHCYVARLLHRRVQYIVRTQPEELSSLSVIPAARFYRSALSRIIHTPPHQGLPTGQKTGEGSVAQSVRIPVSVNGAKRRRRHRQHTSLSKMLLGLSVLASVFLSARCQVLKETPDRDPNSNLSVIGCLIYCTSSALDHAATKAGLSLSLSLVLYRMVDYGEIRAEYILPCNRSDPEINTCVKRAFNHLRPYLQTGTLLQPPAVISTDRYVTSTTCGHIYRQVRYFTHLGPYLQTGTLLQPPAAISTDRTEPLPLYSSISSFVLGRLSLTLLQKTLLHRKIVEAPGIKPGTSEHETTEKVVARDIPVALSAGIPEIGVPPIEPMNIPRMAMENGNGAVRIRAVFSNMTAHGASNYTVLSLKTDLDDYRIDMGLEIPRIEALGKYDVSGNILLFPVRSRGEFTAIFQDVTAVAKLHGKEVTMDDKKYMKVEKLLVDFTLGKSRFRIRDFLNGGNVLGEFSSNAITNADDDEEL
uniref:Uncharacterized protein n=1 Tax=Timema douglasi TaxID=61478 RepID=A0A7R8VSH4_TIMDO|nr:unnamed protein product [Timema douglasi]